MLAYLGRYTHRVAIANSRLVSLANAEVAFRWKDYRHHGKTKLMTLAADEFIRRFLLHTQLDDDRAPRPPDPSLRNHRNRQRELALRQIMNFSFGL